VIRRALIFGAPATATLAVAAMLTLDSPDRANGAGVAVERGIHYQGKDGPRLRVYRPADARRPAPAVIAVHGGTWQHGDKGRMHEFAKQIARETGFVVVKVGYTYASRKRGAWPRQLNDVKDGVRWVRRHAGEYGIDKRRIAAFGSSSGAHIVALLATASRGGSLDRGARVRAAVTWSAFFDLPRMRGHHFFNAIRTFLGCRERPCGRRLRKASPIRHVTRDDPPMLVVNARRELAPLSQPRRMMRKLRSRGIEARLRIVHGRKHGARNASQALGPTVDYLAEVLEE
jgi:acetyl esterase/lipase